jgi:hypothetical protein
LRVPPVPPSSLRRHGPWIAIPFTFPAIIMAIVFVTFALSKEARQMEEARRPGVDRVN